jgi:inorganic pyrophosphatase
MARSALSDLASFDKESGDWRVVVETPKGSHNKYNFEPELGLFILGGVMPEGMSFPYDFGFLPGTKGGDGDPLDVLLLMDSPAFCGCVVPSRLIGVIEAEQAERGGTTERNDRLVAVPVKSRVHSDHTDLTKLNDHRVREITEFFVSYDRVKGKKFKVLDVAGPHRAEKIARDGIKAAQRKRK